ncbi:thiamine pyrophosphate-dependent enzyme [Halopenitus sp. POP-27]|uniref:thiamine pyrophosphate-binding protein n=1 Tax=Halopenitus sp. POP-27 TaxID=2994425 RepID=UPI002468DDC2|nr:thiamine pyrophosphate-dependent enzyme [Halopenitus sp. POP-27]
MPRSGADLFVETLSEYGVEYLFGNPGTTEVPVVEAVDDADLDYILGLQEDIAVGMASGYACTLRDRIGAPIGEAVRLGETPPVGVVNLHIAPGMAHGLGNLYAASVSNAPLVVTAGCHRTDVQHQEPILHGDLLEMTQQFTKWSAEVKRVGSLPQMLRRAFKVAMTPPTGPVFLALPLDVVTAETDVAVRPLEAPPSIGAADPAAVDRAAEAIADAEEPALVVGDQIAWSGADAVAAAVRFAEAAGVRVHGEVLQSSVDFPTDHDQWIGVSGATVDDVRDVTDTDTLVRVGCSTNTPTLGFTDPVVPADTTVIDVGTDSWELGKNEPADVSVVGDIETTLTDLTDAVDSRISAAERDRRLEAVAATKRDRAAAADGSTDSSADSGTPADTAGTTGTPADADGRISKAALVETIESVAPDAYLVDESVTTRRAVFSEFDLGPEGLHGNKSGGLGYGLPASVGAAVAENDREDPRPVIGIIGDGSYLYYPNTIYSAVRHDVDLTVVVSNNANYRILKDNTLRVLGGEESEYGFTAMDFDPHVDIATNAESHGATGRDVVGREAFTTELEDAIDERGPTVLDVAVRD